MERFRKVLACLVCLALAGVAGAGLTACSDMNSGGASSTSSGGGSSGGGY